MINIFRKLLLIKYKVYQGFLKYYCDIERGEVTKVFCSGFPKWFKPIRNCPKI
jgi:hypothetical protein